MGASMNDYRYVVRCITRPGDQDPINGVAGYGDFPSQTVWVSTTHTLLGIDLSTRGALPGEIGYFCQDRAHARIFTFDELSDLLPRLLTHTDEMSLQDMLTIHIDNIEREPTP